MTPPPPPVAGGSARIWKILSVVLTLTIAAIAAYAAVISSKASSSQAEVARLNREDQVRKDQQESLTKAANAISFNSLERTIPRCADFAGTAQQIPNWSLWVAHKAVRGSGQGYFLRKATHTSADWSVSRWTIGGPESVDRQYEITAFYVDVDTSSFLENIRGQSRIDPNASWYSLALPPGLKSPNNIIVQREHTLDQKSCSGSEK